MRSYTYQNDGFELFPYLEETHFIRLQSFALGFLNELFLKYANRSISAQDVLSYHVWGERENIQHGEMLRANNRHINASNEIRSLLINDKLIQLLKKNGVEKFKLWDEGLGWLAFRLIRPRPGDGYPFSCKNWGPAKHVLSIWIPILGFDQNLMIHLMPGSHLKEFPKYLPKDTHFTKDEYRLDYQPSESETLRPKMHPGEAILFHPKTIHAEEITYGSFTRFNLEFRIEPL